MKRTTKPFRFHQTHQLYILAALSIGTSLAVFHPPEQVVVTRPTNTPPLTSSVYVDSDLTPALTEITVCTWYKPFDQPTQVCRLIAFSLFDLIKLNQFKKTILLFRFI